MPMGELHSSVSLEDVSGLVHLGAPPGIVNCRYIASYDWIKDQPASIVVPGMWCSAVVS